MKIPFTNTNSTLGFWSNFLLQDFIATTYGLFYANYSIIFIIFTVHLLQELKVISIICKDVGKYEKNEIIQDILNHIDPGSSQVKVQQVKCNPSETHA